MEKLTVSIPTAIGEITFEIPDDYPIPPVGADFYFNFESVVTDLKEWEALNSVLENNSLTVDKIENGRILLYEGSRPTHPIIEPEQYLPNLELYWEQNP